MPSTFRSQEKASRTLSIGQLLCVLEVDLIVVIFLMLKVDYLCLLEFVRVELVLHLREHLIIEFGEEVKVLSQFNVKNRPDTDAQSHDVSLLSKGLLVPLLLVVSKWPALVFQSNEDMIAILDS